MHGRMTITDERGESREVGDAEITVGPMGPPLCERCLKEMCEGVDLEDGCTFPADCCDRVLLCAECRKPGNHDCDAVPARVVSGRASFTVPISDLTVLPDAPPQGGNARDRRRRRRWVARVAGAGLGLALDAIAGRATDQILRTLGVSARDLFPQRGGRRRRFGL